MLISVSNNFVYECIFEEGSNEMHISAFIRFGTIVYGNWLVSRAYIKETYYDLGYSLVTLPKWFD